MVLSAAHDAHAYNFVIDGYLGDWGVTPGGFNSSDWTPDDGILSKVEDQNTAYLNPGWGGQGYDAEAIYAAKEGNMGYLSIVTGMRPEGLSWLPGDIFFNFGPNSTYGIKTIGPDAGKMYKNPSWNTSPYWGGITDPTSMIAGSGTYLGTLNNFVYAYTYPDAIDYHYVMEMAVPIDYFGDDFELGGTVHWTETCGNDAIDLMIPAHIPEPATISLLGLGLLSLAKFINGRR